MKGYLTKIRNNVKRDIEIQRQSPRLFKYVK